MHGVVGLCRRMPGVWQLALSQAHGLVKPLQARRHFTCFNRHARGAQNHTRARVPRHTQTHPTMTTVLSLHSPLL